MKKALILTVTLVITASLLAVGVSAHGHGRRLYGNYASSYSSDCECPCGLENCRHTGDGCGQCYVDDGDGVCDNFASQQHHGCGRWAR